MSSHVLFASQIQSPELFVPPLRHPPKYVAGLPYDPWVANSLNALDSGYQHFKPEKENRFHERREAHNMKSESEMCGNRSTITGLVQAKEAQQKGRVLGESVVYRKKPEADSSTIKEKFHGRNSHGLPLVNQSIEPPEVQSKRMPANARQPRNIQDDLGMDGTSFQVTENNKAMEDKWQKITRKVQDLSIKQVDNGGRDTASSQDQGRQGRLGKE